MHIRSLAYRTDLALLRAGGSVVSDHDDHVVVRTPDNPTFWWGNFVLIPELPKTRDAIERRLSLFREAFPEADHVAIGVDVVTAEGVPEGALAEASVRWDVGASSTSVSMVQIRRNPQRCNIVLDTTPRGS